MILLTQIEKTDDFIKCVAYIEDSETPVPLTYSIQADEFFPFKYPPGYEWCTAHIAHAKRFIKKNKDKLPREENIMWY